MNLPPAVPQGLVLAFDFGLRQIGVAVGETQTRSARPLTILKASDGVPDWQLVARRVDEFRPAFLVVGLPLNIDGSESAMSGRARKFGNRLHGRFGLPVYWQDERLSSREVKSVAAEKPARGRRAARLDQVDDRAAALILQDFLGALPER